MLKIVTDGSADMPEEWLSKYKIDVIPLAVNFGEEVYLQGRDINFDKFYQLVKEKKLIPHSSLPSLAQVKDFFRKIAKRTDDVLAIHVGSKLSGTFDTVQTAARELKDEIHIQPFDSGAGSAALGFMCKEARLQAKAGRTLKEILSKLVEIRKKLTVIFTVDNLEYARMSGRVNAVQSILSSILKIKPIIVLRNGLLQIGEKVRTRQHALERIIQTVKENVGNKKVEIAVVHAADPTTASKLAIKIKTMFQCKEVIVTDLSIPVAANLGPGTVGIVAIPVAK